MSSNSSRAQRLRELDRERTLFNNSRDSTSRHAEGESSVCFAATEGGLRGKIRVDKDGKHSFRDDSLEELRPIPTPAWEKTATQERGRKGVESSLRSGKDKDRDRTVKRASSADGWQKLLQKEQRSRLKRKQYHGNDKTLLVLLEEERTKYMQLESDYNKLLADVQALQNSHTEELQSTERKIDSDRRSLEGFLAVKSDEIANLKKQLQSWQGRYSDESAAWARTNEKLEAQVTKLQRQLGELEGKGVEQDKTAQKLVRLHKELTESSALKDTELRKVKEALRETEAQLLKEKESKIQTEVQALQLDHFVTQRDDEIKTLKVSVQKKQAELDELPKLRGALTEIRKEMDSFAKRERKYMEELEQAGRRERKLVMELEDSAGNQKRSGGEVDRLNSRLASQAEDIEHLRNVEVKLRQELHEGQSRIEQLADEKGQVERQLRNLQNEYNEVQQENNDLRKLSTDFRNQLHNKELGSAELRAAVEGFTREKEILNTQRAELLSELQARQRDILDLQNRLDEANRQLSAASQQKTELKITTQQKLASVSDRIEELQGALQEAQGQLRTFRDMEGALRGALKQREDTLKAQIDRIAALQAQNSELQGRLAQDAHEREVGRQRKKEEILAMHDKINAAKSAMEADVTALKSQLQQKNAQLSTASDDITRVKLALTEQQAEKFRLEARLSELSAAESSHARQVATLQATLQRKDQESTLMMLKHQALVEQLRRLEDEVHAWRNTGAKDAEIGRLQANIAEMSRRLKTQVDVLLDGAGGYTAQGADRSRPLTPTPGALGTDSPFSPILLGSGLDRGGTPGLPASGTTYGAGRLPFQHDVPRSSSPISRSVSPLPRPSDLLAQYANQRAPPGSVSGL
ncbi:hypothetical protein HK097_005079 [Rhizophlyctis rosea]|uniref:Uncharacterized protein n=1 Tax=Rhizophlyctis rosea TaxID=64517 RepID=A0AAD5X8Y3_9FUNG|nr:hypothetical protein HK097_005079 [Rhizophlyctis rosea]